MPEEVVDELVSSDDAAVTSLVESADAASPFRDDWQATHWLHDATSTTNLHSTRRG